MNTVIIVQARMTSTRLPGKVMMTVLGRPLLDYQIERLKRVQEANGIVIATTNNDADRPVVELAHSLGVGLFRGSEQDVLLRYCGAAAEFHADTIVRITSDCPLIDPSVVDLVIRHYRSASGSFDYVSNILHRTFPRGMDCEVFSRSALDNVHNRAADPFDREHVTRYIYQHPERYRLGNVAADEDHSHHRWTVDTMEDFDLVRRMLESLYPVRPLFSLEDCLALAEEHQEWSELNRHVEQTRV